MELQDTEKCILCGQIINAYVNIPTSTYGISKMKIKIAQHTQCKKHYDSYVRLKFREKIVMNLLEDKKTEIMHFLHEKELKDKIL
jgi:hypothetical protein